MLHATTSMRAVPAACRAVACLVLAATAAVLGPAAAAGHDDDAPSRVRFLSDREGRALPLPDEEDAFTFAVLGDRTGGPAEGIKVLAQAVGEVNLIEPDLVLTVGDLIEGYNGRERWLEQMREFRSTMDALSMPWFPVAGNHDVYWRGADRPANEHESDYETHFGPLWYAFAHKNAWFIVLYSDEGDPETGQKTFNEPAAQRMSPEQLAWLEHTLAQASEADHVFVFLHHPRWIGGNYGDDWERVHAVLAGAGNVTAVFAGHIHKIRHDGVRDGIEYVTLATTGGAQAGYAERAGWLHHFNLVTVRRDHVALATIPVGTVMDPRAITPEVSDNAARLRSFQPEWDQALQVAADGAADGTAVIALRNTVDRPIAVEIVPQSGDSRWQLRPDHAHLQIAPGERRVVPLRASRPAGAMDEHFRWPEVTVTLEYLADSFRVPIEPASFPIALEPTLPPPAAATADRVLAVGGSGGASVVRIETFDKPELEGPFTVEAWCRARIFPERVGLVNNTESSGFGIFLDRGRPTFLVHLGGRYRSAEAPEAVLEPGRWHHLAGVYDGAEVRLYVDGALVARGDAPGRYRANDLPIMVGADVDRMGRPTSMFEGWIDEVRLSTAARYTGDRFAPERRFEPDDATAVLLHLDEHWGAWTRDASGRDAHGVLVGAAAIVDRP